MNKLIIIASTLFLSGCTVIHPLNVAFFGFENNLALMKETSPIDSSVFIPIDKALPKTNQSRRGLDHIKSK